MMLSFAVHIWIYSRGSNMYIEHYCDKCGGPLRLWIDNIPDKDKPVEIEITPKPD